MHPTFLNPASKVVRKSARFQSSEPCLWGRQAKQSKFSGSSKYHEENESRLEVVGVMWHVCLPLLSRKAFLKRWYLNRVSDGEV